MTGCDMGAVLMQNFGSYGPQEGDGMPTEQRQIIAGVL